MRLEQSRSQPGSGLGLSLASAVARLHGGELTLEDNQPGSRASLPCRAEGRYRVRDEATRQKESRCQRSLQSKPAHAKPRADRAAQRWPSASSTAPQLVDAKAARARVADWLAGLPGTQAKAAQGAACRASDRQHAAGKPRRKLAVICGSWRAAIRNGCCGCCSADPDRHLDGAAGRDRARGRGDRATKPRRCGCCAA